VPKARWFKRRREEERRRKDRDQTKIVEEVFDSQTIAHLEKLVRRGIIREVKGVISSGKEARIYWGRDRSHHDVAIKIYMSFTSDFRKSIKKYIIGDPRFEGIPAGNLRKLIYEWTRKEYRNLQKLKAHKVRVPRPIAFSGNILVMEFLGENGYRAPLLAEALSSLSREEAANIMVEVVSQAERIVCDAGLVHGDLSEYNIMLWQGVPWIIDVSQAVPLSHPLALELLERDIRNLTVLCRRICGGEGGVEDRLYGILECARREVQDE